MKKILITLLTAMLFLTGCSNRSVSKIKEETKSISESHGLKDVSIRTLVDKRGKTKGLDVIITTSGGYSQLEGKEMMEMYSEIIKLESTHQLKKAYMGIIEVFENDDKFFITSNGVIKNNERFHTVKKRKENNSKDDWYNEHPGDSDWKNVVDGLTELYGGDE